VSYTYHGAQEGQLTLTARVVGPMSGTELDVARRWTVAEESIRDGIEMVKFGGIVSKTTHCVLSHIPQASEQRTP
jgi:hypothetical protein